MCAIKQITTTTTQQHVHNEKNSNTPKQQSHKTIIVLDENSGRVSDLVFFPFLLSIYFKLVWRFIIRMNKWGDKEEKCGFNRLRVTFSFSFFLQFTIDSQK